MRILLQAVVAVLVFGLLIFIHELGHFTVAKLSGMRVNEFAIGMGPVLWRSRRGETQYALRLLPIGGFVAVEGEDEDSSDPRAYCNVRLWKRILFVCAGALMNLLLGFALFAALVGQRDVLPTTTVSQFHSDAAAASQLQIGDRILRVNGSRGMQVLEDGTRVVNPGFYVATEPKTFWGGARYTVLWMISIVRQVWFSFLNLITGNFKLSELSGPVGVSTVIGQASTMGLGTLTTLVGFITVNIGVFNLLPLPALDGGRLLFLLIELVLRRPVNPKYEGAIHTAGFVLLMGLMLVVTFNDILKFF